MRQRKLSKSWKNIFKLLVIPLGIVILLSVLIFLPGKLIKINKIECESQYNECPSDIQFTIYNFHSKAGYSFTNLSKTKEEIEKFLDENKLVSDYSIQYSFPDKLKVNILLKKAKFAILNKDSGKFVLLGGKGEVLGSTDESSLPTVVQSGETPNLFALSIMEGVFNMYQITRGEIVGSGLVVELPTGKRVIFPLEGDKDLLLGSLRLIYSEVDDREIDLRFKNPVLR